MKDKITVSILCVCLIGVYWMSRATTINSNNEFFSSEKSMPTISEDTTADYIDFEIPETTITSESKLINEISEFNSCLLSPDKTDALTFSEAFGYYRKCQGNESDFSWKGTEYTTLLANEVIIENIDSVAIKTDNLNSDISDIR